MRDDCDLDRAGAGYNSCKDFRGRVRDFVDGCLDEREAGEVGEHIDRCIHCTREALRCRREAALFRTAVREALGNGARVPQGFREGLLLCMRCIDDPGSAPCPRLARRLRLV